MRSRFSSAVCTPAVAVFMGLSLERRAVLEERQEGEREARKTGEAVPLTALSDLVTVGRNSSSTISSYTPCPCRLYSSSFSRAACEQTKRESKSRQSRRDQCILPRRRWSRVAMEKERKAERQEESERETEREKKAHTSPKEQSWRERT